MLTLSYKQFTTKCYMQSAGWWCLEHHSRDQHVHKKQSLLFIKFHWQRKPKYSWRIRVRREYIKKCRRIGVASEPNEAATSKANWTTLFNVEIHHTCQQTITIQVPPRALHGPFLKSQIAKTVPKTSRKAIVKNTDFLSKVSHFGTPFLTVFLPFCILFRPGPPFTTEARPRSGKSEKTTPQKPQNETKKDTPFIRIPFMFPSFGSLISKWFLPRTQPAICKRGPAAAGRSP